MTARHFDNTCPDCNRWRCVCWQQDAVEGDAAAPDLARLVSTREAVQAAPVRTGPPPQEIRARLAALRADIAAHLPHLARP